MTIKEAGKALKRMKWLMRFRAAQDATLFFMVLNLVLMLFAVLTKNGKLLAMTGDFNVTVMMVHIPIMITRFILENKVRKDIITWEELFGPLGGDNEDV